MENQRSLSEPLKIFSVWRGGITKLLVISGIDQALWIGSGSPSSDYAGAFP